MTCPAHNEPKLTVLATAGDAERRLKRDEHQHRCKLCGRWIWRVHFTKRSAIGERDDH